MTNLIFLFPALPVVIPFRHHRFSILLQALQKEEICRHKKFLIPYSLSCCY
jgi:hypothetical protein